jgi:hypothetical protein
MIVSGWISLKRESWSSDICESLIHAFRRNAAGVSTKDDQAQAERRIVAPMAECLETTHCVH